MKKNSLCFLALFFHIFYHTEAKAATFTRTQILMGNVPVSITLKSDISKRQKAVRSIEKAFEEERRIEKEVSEWQPASQTTRLNQNAGGDWLPIGKDLMSLLIKAREISEITEGAFDVTFASQDPRATFRDVKIIPEKSVARLKRRHMKIGVSGIAKGYIVDQMSRVLQKEGFKKFLINAGDLFVAGEWKVAIKNPYGDTSQTLCRLTLKDKAISTSGLYERGPHIINPHTRKPARGLASMTAIASTSIQADTLATAGFVLGKKRMDLIKKRVPDVELLWVDRQGVFGGSADLVSLCRKSST